MAPLNEEYMSCFMAPEEILDEEYMSPAIGILRFKQLKQKAYAEIWDTIMEIMEVAASKGQDHVTIRRFPPYTMRLIADELMSVGYDVTIEVGEYSGDIALSIVWDN